MPLNCFCGWGAFIIAIKGWKKKGGHPKKLTRGGRGGKKSNKKWLASVVNIPLIAFFFYICFHPKANILINSHLSFPKNHSTTGLDL